jgi:hypothetical protein
MPNRWGDDHLVEEAARDYLVRYGVNAGLERAKAEYALARNRRDTLASEAWADIRDAIGRQAN